MYLSYLMGAGSISDQELQDINIQIVGKTDSGSRKLEIPDDSVDSYKELLYAKLDKGFWNEFLNKDEIVFIFKFKDGHLAEYVLSSENKNEIMELCYEFNDESKDSRSAVHADILKYIVKNDFYTDFINKHHDSLSDHSEEALLIYGMPHEEAVYRKAIVAVLFDKNKNKIVTLDWKIFPCSGLVTGGVDEGEDLESALTREIIEETGYTDFQVKQKLGREIISYFHATNKNVWRKAEMHGYLVVLNSDEQQDQKLEEPEDFEVVWKTPSEYIEEVENTAIDDKNDYRPYKVFVERALRVQSSEY